MRVHRLVRRVLDGVDPGERACLVGERADALGVEDRADRVRRPSEGDYSRALGELALEVVVVERGVVEQLDVPHDQVAVVGELEPRSDASVVVERGDEDLVAGREVSPGGAREHEVQRGHVRAEDHLVRAAAEHARGLALRFEHDLADAPRGLVQRAHVRARLAQGTGDLVGNL